MKPTLGPPARGEAFYPRPKIVKALFRILDANTSVYLSAPRRVGKTSILKHLEDTQDGPYYFVYSITESIDSTNNFFKILFEDLMNSNAIGRLKRFSHSIGTEITLLLGKIKSVKGVELRENAETDYYSLLIDFFEKIEKDTFRVVIMIDEFPQTITNIRKKHGEAEAARFIQLNREMRHHKVAEQKVSFIYTGSISLHPVVEKVISLTAVNDLKTLRVEPWLRAEAKEMLVLLSVRDGIEFEEGAIDFLLDTLQWFIPFHLQLVYAELQNIFDDKGAAIAKMDVGAAVEKVVDIKNKAQFEPYFSRLKNLLERNEYEFAMDVLKHAAKNGVVDTAILNNLSVKYAVQEFTIIVNGLCDDGYLDKRDKLFYYTSPILQLWCLKHICDENG